MDRNSIIGLSLIGLILLTFSYLNRPSTEEVERFSQQQDSIALITKANEIEAVKTQSEIIQDSLPAVVENDSIAIENQKQQLGSFASSAAGEETFTTLENELLKVTFSNKGGRMVFAQLKKYKTHDSLPVILFEGEDSEMELKFFAQNRTISTGNLYFKTLGESKNISGEELATITMRLEVQPGSFIDQIYTLKGNSYLVGYNVVMKGMQDIIAPNISTIELDWKLKARRHELSRKNEIDNTSVYYRFAENDVDELSIGEDPEQETLKTSVTWVAFKQQFFSSVLISDSGFDKPTTVSADPEADESYVRNMAATFSLPFNHKSEENIEMRFYLGPNHYQTLKSFDLDLEKLIPLGWGIFGWVNRYLVIPVFNFLNSFDLNFGLIILILTLFIKVLILPLTYKAYLSSAKMKVLKPEIDELSAKFKEEPLKLQQETMGLYKKAGVNPLGGCIPMLLQFPILIAMFRFFPASIELRQESFLWAHDLSTYDSILDLPFTIPFYGAHVSLFTLLMTISTLLYTKYNSSMTGSMNPQMKWMMYLMPVMFLGLFNNFAAGLSYYYFLSNVISIGQQFAIKGLVNEDEIHRKIQENKKKPQSNKKSKFQQRLEDMAKQKGINAPKK